LQWSWGLIHRQHCSRIFTWWQQSRPGNRRQRPSACASSAAAMTPTIKNYLKTSARRHMKKGSVNAAFLP